MEIVGDNLALSIGELSGSYKTPIRDVGYVATFSITIDAMVVITTSLAFDSDPSRRFNDSETLRFLGQEAVGVLSFKIRTSADNITWTPWEAFQKGDYYCRYFQLEMTITRTALDVDLQCTRFNYSADLPDVNEKGSGEVTVALSGDSIVFTKVFHQEPVVNVSILSGNGVYYRFSSKDSTGFNVLLYDASGNEVIGTYEYHAYGV